MLYPLSYGRVLKVPAFEPGLPDLPDLPVLLTPYGNTATASISTLNAGCVPDGRFLMLRNHTSAETPHIVLVQNWLAELTRQVR